MDAIERHGLFQAIDEQSMIKIDFHVGEKIPGELQRGTRREIAPGLFAPLVARRTPSCPSSSGSSRVATRAGTT